jgi:tetratricopeptide (TPR) repeat protein
MPVTGKEVRMKKLFMLSVLSLFLLSAVSVIHAEEDAYQKGLMLYKKRNYKAAIGQLKSYTENTPDPRAYYLIGYASYKIRDYATAKKYFSDVYLIDPEFKVSSIDLQ